MCTVGDVGECISRLLKKDGKQDEISKEKHGNNSLRLKESKTNSKIYVAGKKKSDENVEMEFTKNRTKNQRLGRTRN